MPAFALTPSNAYPVPTGEFPQGLQWQFEGEDVGTRGGIDTINIVAGAALSVTVGTGETANVLTIEIPSGSGNV
jgi:hypothetical protein